MIKIELERVAGDYGFAAKDAYGHVVHTDSSPESGREFWSTAYAVVTHGVG